MRAALALFLLGLLAPPVRTPAPAYAPAAVTAAASSTWAEFTPDSRLFTVRMPGRPTEKLSTTQTAAGPARISQYVYEGGGSYFGVVISEFPSGTASKRLPQQVLDGARDGSLANVRGRAVEEFEVFLPAPSGKTGPLPGRQIVAELPPDYVLRSRLFLMDDTLIQLLVIQKKANDAPRAFLKMADSFRLSR